MPDYHYSMDDLVKAREMNSHSRRLRDLTNEAVEAHIESMTESRRMAERYGVLRTRPLTEEEKQSFEAAMAGTTEGFKAFFIHPNEGEQEMAQDTQAAPIPNDGPSMHDLAVEVIKERREIGLKEYGTILQTNNGRDFLTDSIEEVADLLCYLVGAREEAKQESQPAIAGYKRRNELLTESRNAYMNRCEDLEESLSRESKAFDDVKEERDELRTQYADVVSELGDAREANVDLRTELSRSRNRNLDVTARLDATQASLDIARGANGRFQQRYLEQRREITELQYKVGKFDQVEGAYQNRIERLAEVKNRFVKDAHLRLEHIRKLEKTIVDAIDKSSTYVLKAYDIASERDQ